MPDSGTQDPKTDAPASTASPPETGAPEASRSVEEQLKQLVDYIARALVDKPDEVEVKDVEEDGGLVLELIVAEEDLGKVIGRQGRTARAIRNVLSAAAMKTQRRVSLEILE